MHCINECDESHPISLVGVGGGGVVPFELLQKS